MEAIFESPPFSKASQLCSALEVDVVASTTSRSVPGQPCIMIDDFPRMAQFLEMELCAAHLEALEPRLWIMSTQSGTNINPLHRQRVRGREIIVTEQPRLHLLWFHDRIFVKPLPKHLLSHEFWEIFFVNKSSLLGGRRDAIRKAIILLPDPA